MNFIRKEETTQCNVFMYKNAEWVKNIWESERPLKASLAADHLPLNSQQRYMMEYIEHLSKHLFDIDSCSCIKDFSPSFPFLCFFIFIFMSSWLMFHHDGKELYIVTTYFLFFFLIICTISFSLQFSYKHIYIWWCTSNNTY